MGDLAIRHGRVLTPDGWRTQDLIIIDGLVSDDPPSPGCLELEAKDLLVVPGLIDLHAHVYYGGARLGINPDKLSATSGVTTWVDAGTSGAGNFEGLLLHVKQRAKSRVVPFINMSVLGLTSIGMPTRDVGELWDPSFGDTLAILRAAEEFPGEIRGIKLRASYNALGDSGPSIFPQARYVADELDVPLMIHLGMAPPTIGEVCQYVRDGDILTHCFNGHPGGRITDRAGKVLPEVRDAVERGVHLDVGHGLASMSYDVARQCLDQGLVPHSLSSDVHAESLGVRVRSILTVMELFLELGLSLEEVLDRVTRRPADIIREPNIGRLSPGKAGDVAVLSLEDRPSVRQDTNGTRITVRSKMVHHATVVGGEVLQPIVDGRQESRASIWTARFGADPELAADA